jgi:hypothetical protein
MLMCGVGQIARADDAKFGLAGPSIDVYVTRGGATLPIAQVPNLLPKDKLRVKMDLPTTQTNHLLLIVAFLRGSTNEPPNDWFTKIETWKPLSSEGTTVIVPDGAQRALLFVAPETGGDFSTLRSAVKGNPGTFLLAAASLNKASYDAQRIARYLVGMQSVALSDQAAILARSADLAATLALKPSADCFKQPVADQVDCLTSTSKPLLLDDGHAQTITDTLSSGASSDFINEASTTDGGVYSAYVGTLVDLVHMVELMRTAQYRYIPAITVPLGARLNLMLNAAPSFNNPKSVIVVGLPDIRSVQLPLFTLSDPAQVFCLQNAAMSIPLRGSPLFFATSFAHDVTLNLDATVRSRRINLIADASAGGLIRSENGAVPLRTKDLAKGSEVTSGTNQMVQGRLHGYWGFDPFDGPTLRFQRTVGTPWTLVNADALETGTDTPVVLLGHGTACLDHVGLLEQDGSIQPIAIPLAAIHAGAASLSFSLPLKDAQTGAYRLVIQEKGREQPATVALTVASDTVHLNKLLLNPISNDARLLGKGLGKVVSVQLGAGIYLPVQTADGSLLLHPLGADEYKGNARAIATLKDGRTVAVDVSLEHPETVLKLLRFDATPSQRAGELAISLNSPSDIPLDGILRFAVQSEGVFPHTQMIEIATADGSVRTRLSIKEGELVLQDDHTAVASVDLLKAFGQSAFGEFRLRAVGADETFGDWIPVGRLVRRPHITSIQCTRSGRVTCRVAGTDLFLARAFSATESFDHAATVPIGFDDPILSIRIDDLPRNGQLFVQLRDGSNVIASVQLKEPHNLH